MISVEQILVLLLTSKVCPRCETRKALSKFSPNAAAFFGVSSNCKPCHREVICRWRLAHPEQNRAATRARRNKNPEGFRAAKRAWYGKNREKARAVSRAWYEKNREKVLATARAWRIKNPEKVLAKARINRNYVKRRRTTDSEFKLLSNMRTRIRRALKMNTKGVGTRDLIGCTISELRAHLESLFVPGMTWENYGPVWHVDHVRPCASFDFSAPSQQRECFHYTNLQPLFAEENFAKGAKIL